MDGMMDMGCLVIDGLGGGGVLADMAAYLRKHGMWALEYVRTPGIGLHEGLQRAYQQIRIPDRANAIVAAGAGCDCALAIAAQLPVERLVLLCPEDGRKASGEYRRVRAYGLRNAALCTCDTLVIGWSGADSDPLMRLCRSLCACRVQALVAGENLWTIRKEVLKLGVFRFLCDGVLPKSLAENPEMCIIYG